MSLFIPALTERGPPGASCPTAAPGVPAMPVGASGKFCAVVLVLLQHIRSRMRVMVLPPTMEALPASHRPPPSCPTPTHSFSRARSPKKEPFSSTVILLLLSSLWEEQRERGSPVT